MLPDVKYQTFITKLIRLYSGSISYFQFIKKFGCTNVWKRMHFARPFRRVCDGCQEDESLHKIPVPTGTALTSDEPHQSEPSPTKTLELMVL